MQINWLGQGCFKITHKETTIVIDPYEKNIGLKPPRAKADILLVSNRDSSGIESISGDYFIINSPGEYEIGGIFIYGLEIGAKNKELKTIFRLEIEEISLAHLDGLNRKLTDNELEKLENVDILFVPVGAGDVLDAKKAVEVINAIEPRLVIPMYYKIKGLKLDLDSVDKFIKELGLKNPEVLSKLNIKKKDLSQEESRFVILKEGL